MNQEEVQIDISDEDFLVIARLAHEKDLTFNQFVNKILKDRMDEYDGNFQIYKQQLRVEFHETVNYDVQSGVYENDIYIEYLEKKLYEANIPVIHSIS